MTLFEQELPWSRLYPHLVPNRDRGTSVQEIGSTKLRFDANCVLGLFTERRYEEEIGSPLAFDALGLAVFYLQKTYQSKIVPLPARLAF